MKVAKFDEMCSTKKFFNYADGSKKAGWVKFNFKRFVSFSSSESVKSSRLGGNTSRSAGFCVILVVNVSFISSTILKEKKSQSSRMKRKRKKEKKSLHRNVKFLFIIRARREKPEIQEIEIKSET